MKERERVKNYQQVQLQQKGGLFAPLLILRIAKLQFVGHIYIQRRDQTLHYTEIGDESQKDYLIKAKITLYRVAVAATTTISMTLTNSEEYCHLKQ